MHTLRRTRSGGKGVTIKIYTKCKIAADNTIIILYYNYIAPPTWRPRSDRATATLLSQMRIRSRGRRASSEGRRPLRKEAFGAVVDAGRSEKDAAVLCQQKKIEQQVGAPRAPQDARRRLRPARAQVLPRLLRLQESSSTARMELGSSAAPSAIGMTHGASARARVRARPSRSPARRHRTGRGRRRHSSVVSRCSVVHGRVPHQRLSRCHRPTVAS